MIIIEFNPGYNNIISKLGYDLPSKLSNEILYMTDFIYEFILTYDDGAILHLFT